MMVQRLTCLGVPLGLFFVASFMTGDSLAQPPLSRLQSGEFAAALNDAANASPQQRDQFLAKISTAQSAVGDSVAANSTLRGIESAEARSQVIETNNGAAGGSSFADFGSLMALIETTVVPDTWESLGGPSTMAPYPQGVFVDPQGTLRECETLRHANAMDNLVAQLDDAATATGHAALFAPSAWRTPSPLRSVSLRRLRDALSSYQVSGQSVPESIQYLAGLSQVRFVQFTDDDIVLSGEVGGIETYQGWYRDRVTARNTMRLDFLLTCLAAAQNGQSFGCTIDPSREGLQNAVQAAVGIQNKSIPIGTAAEAVRVALGMQRVEVFGTPPDTVLGYVMVEADRHMKQLALGERELPEGAIDYLDAVDTLIARGPPRDLLLRLWFTASPRSVRSDTNQRVFEIQGTPIRLSGQNERAIASGQRGHLTNDPRTELFVADFNQNWDRIRQQYPIYGALESVYQAASIAELAQRYTEARAHDALIQSVSQFNADRPWMLTAPRQVESIATMHTVRHGKQNHHIVIASGGVSVDPKQTLPSQFDRYATLDAISASTDPRPRLLQRWWWDSEE
ncbi:hypothetical protein Pla52o_10150 [Novipirellula galeiformis]|uniref:Uncharacterized protein n=1 Tax=Novipirellula galeiformis TaxID=2528004 RepID=A0A5C6CUR2_9BACT|nr:DUF1598 domain-containing protein [Novipirellula galeiformis]TWU27151.1 hypothetical protein Pla52o_10150 [Novipirellula galeiformis]